MADTTSIQKQKQQSLPPPPHPRILMILTTAAILFGNIAFGCAFTSFSPALDDLKSKYNTSIDDISVIFTVVLVVYCIGAITCGFVSTYVNRQLVVIAGFSGMAFSMYFTPHCQTEIVFFAIGGVLGFSTGLYDTTQIVWIIEIWQDRAGPYIQAQHFFFAVGTSIPSLLTAPFLASDDEEIGTISSVVKSRIYIPFTILGVFCSLALAFQIFLFIFYRYYKPPMYVAENFEQTHDTTGNISQMEVELAEDISKPQQKTGMTIRKLQLIVITGIFLAAYQGMETCTFDFVPTFGQYSDLKMTETASAYVLTGLTGMFTVGRAIGILIIFKVRPELLVGVSCVFIIVANVILLIWANSNLMLFWTGCLILGTGYSTMFPSFCAFMEKYLVFTSAIGSVITVSGSVVSATYPLVVGKIIEQNAVVLTYTNFLSTIACIIAMSWGCILTNKNKIRER